MSSGSVSMYILIMIVMNAGGNNYHCFRCKAAKPLLFHVLLLHGERERNTNPVMQRKRSLLLIMIGKLDSLTG